MKDFKYLQFIRGVKRTNMGLRRFFRKDKWVSGKFYALKKANEMYQKLKDWD
jgi:hypothetical protein